MRKELQMVPTDLCNMLASSFFEDVPNKIETVEELTVASEMISRTINQYSYLSQLLMESKLQCREFQRLKRENKEMFTKSYEDSVDRKELIEKTLENVKQRYKGLSRLISVKQEINQELKMGEYIK